MDNEQKMKIENNEKLWEKIQKRLLVLDKFGTIISILERIEAVEQGLKSNGVKAWEMVEKLSSRTLYAISKLASRAKSGIGAYIPSSVKTSALPAWSFIEDALAVSPTLAEDLKISINSKVAPKFKSFNCKLETFAEKIMPKRLEGVAKGAGHIAKLIDPFLEGINGVINAWNAAPNEKNSARGKTAGRVVGAFGTSELSAGVGVGAAAWSKSSGLDPGIGVFTGLTAGFMSNMIMNDPIKKFLGFIGETIGQEIDGGGPIKLLTKTGEVDVMHAQAQLEAGERFINGLTSAREMLTGMVVTEMEKIGEKGVIKGGAQFEENQSIINGLVSAREMVAGIAAAEIEKAGREGVTKGGAQFEENQSIINGLASVGEVLSNMLATGLEKLGEAEVIRSEAQLKAWGKGMYLPEEPFMHHINDVQWFNQNQYDLQERQYLVPEGDDEVNEIYIDAPVNITIDGNKDDEKIEQIERTVQEGLWDLQRQLSEIQWQERRLSYE